MTEDPHLIEAAANELLIEIAIQDPETWDRLREKAHRLRAALSAARPSSPTPEETRAPFVRELEAFLYSDDARDATGAFGFTPPIGNDFRERLIAAATPGDDATTKEGR